MKLTQKEIKFIYQMILNSMELVDRTTPIGYVETLQSLEIKFCNVLSND